MNQMKTLLTREFIENRSMMLYVPAAVVAFIVFLQLLILSAIGVGEEGWMSVDVEADSGETRTIFVGAWYDQMLDRLALMSPGERDEVIETAYYAISGPLFGIMWFFAFFYLLGALYEDRRDRSVLFWKSMPVSDAVTVVSKLLTGVLIIPGIYFAAIFVVQFVFLTTSTLSLGEVPETVSAAIFDPSGMFGRWASFIGFHLVTILWCAPFYAWALLVSAWAKSVPFMWALGVPVLVSVVDALAGTGEVGEFFVRHSLPVGLDDEHRMTLGETVIDYGSSWELPLAVALAGVFVFLAIRVRGRADEI